MAAAYGYQGDEDLMAEGKNLYKMYLYRTYDHDEVLLPDNSEIQYPTIVSMNPIMVDGTGMCGACRVIVGGEVKFACRRTGI